MAAPVFPKALTLVEYSQTFDDDSLERAFLETFVRESDVSAALPMVSAKNGKYSYVQEEELPEVKHRAYNEAGNESKGKTSRQEEGVFLMDEYIKVDRALVDNKGLEERAKQEEMKTKEMARHFTRDFLHGDNTSDPREPDGLKVRSLRGDQKIIHNSSASGGGALSLFSLDEAINEVRNPTHIIVDRVFRPLLNAAARNPNLTNNMLNLDHKDPFGRNVLAFGDLPFLFGYPKSRGDTILPFNEVASGGGPANTGSLFVVSFGEDGIMAIEGTSLAVRDEGQIPGVPFFSTHVKWDFGFVSKEYSMARIDSVTLAPIVS